jgi:hypothetical protein
MGILDRARDAANQALTATQQAAVKGQEKVNELQQGRDEKALYTTLGHAFYAEQRSGGPKQAVVDALSALDAHFAEIAARVPGTPGYGAAPGSAPTTPPATPPPAAPGEPFQS